MAQRVLWLAPQQPHPPQSGLTVYSQQLSESLARAGASVVGLGLTSPEQVAGRGVGQAAATWVPVRGGPRSRSSSVASRLPSMSHVNGTPAYRQALHEQLDRGGWSAIVFDHLIVGWALQPVVAWMESTGCTPVLVHVSHNHETTVRRDVARREAWYSPRRLVLGLDAVKIRRLEAGLVRHADVVTTITASDAAAFAPVSLAPPVLVPPGWGGRPARAREIDAQTPRRVVALGNWDWHVKQRNLERFLSVADPLFAAEGIELLVAGPAPAGWVERLVPELRATTFSGWVDDMGQLLSSARLALVSEPAGGGFKLKSLDYVFHRVPLAVLAGSMEGLPLRPGLDYFEAGDEVTLAAGIVELIDDEERLNTMQEAAFARCQPLLDMDHQGRDLLAAIESASLRTARRSVRAGATGGPITRAAERRGGRPTGSPRR